jgi:hypothetical protein
MNTHQVIDVLRAAEEVSSLLERNPDAVRSL